MAWVKSNWIWLLVGGAVAYVAWQVWKSNKEAAATVEESNTVPAVDVVNESAPGIVEVPALASIDVESLNLSAPVIPISVDMVGGMAL